MKYRFLQALDIIVGTGKRLKPEHEDYWLRYDVDKGCLTRNGAIVPWPTLSNQTAKIWEIEPETLYVWGVENSHGEGRLAVKKPFKGADDYWTLDCRYPPGIFSKKKLQKFKLVPVEDEE